MEKILSKALRRETLTETEALSLWERVPLQVLAAAADEVRRAEMARLRDEAHLRDEASGAGRETVSDTEVVTWQIDRNVNITNVCVSGCRFCNFHCRPAETEKAWVMPLEDYIPRIEETLALGGDQLLLQGGLHPRLGIEFYTELFAGLKNLFPQLKLHALGAPEVAHIARVSGITVRETLERLVEAGLDSLPGAGAEILVDEVRKAISPAKPSVSQWLDVMREAHRMNIPTSATMMYGHIETPRHIVQHLLTIRDLQAERPACAHGFVAFIPWIFRSEGTQLEKDGVRPRFSPTEYLRVIALSRLMLNNIPNIQASWLTVGAETAQMALHSGANDMGSIMIEERVVSSAGARNSFDADGIRAAIRAAGFTPRLRDQLYRPRPETPQPKIVNTPK
ncbi:MAG: CofH family radical SAM protein [Alistipes sp.]|jgi:cyclic dehypoxanthinyl futalosine synthase|nr:CofH family radical SAM protein [Alistipes sp.]